MADNLLSSHDSTCVIASAYTPSPSTNDQRHSSFLKCRNVTAITRKPRRQTIALLLTPRHTPSQAYGQEEQSIPTRTSVIIMMNPRLSEVSARRYERATMTLFLVWKFTLLSRSSTLGRRCRARSLPVRV